MKMRRSLRSEECICMHDHRGNFIEDVPFEELFLGGCGGVMLSKRGTNDPHVCFAFLVEDDNAWHVGSSGTSSFWMDDYIEALAEAKKWLEENAEQGKWGWTFKA